MWKSFSKKHETLRMDYINSGLNMCLKLVSLHCSWAKVLFDDCFHKWKNPSIFDKKVSLRFIQMSTLKIQLETVIIVFHQVVLITWKTYLHGCLE